MVHPIIDNSPSAKKVGVYGCPIKNNEDKQIEQGKRKVSHDMVEIIYFVKLKFHVF